jgi:PHD/YefM family antitoxin component YafN of YafNO toxin-antitoxin module
MSSLAIQPLTSKYHKSAFKCLMDYFFTQEPMVKALNISRESIEPYVKELIEKAIDDRLSFVQLNDNQEVVAVVIAEDYFGEPSDTLLELSAGLEPVFALLEKVGSTFCANNLMKTNRFYHLLMIASAEKGAATFITKVALEFAKKKGFVSAVVEATGTISQHIIQNTFHFKELQAVPYANFEYNGKKVFEDITTSEACKFYEKEL